MKPSLWTVARIAKHLKIPRHRVEYVIDSREITPSDRAGIARVFARRDVERIASEIRGMRDRKDTASGKGDA